MKEFNNKSRPKNKEGKDEKKNTCENSYAPYKGRRLSLNAFKGRIFPIKATKKKYWTY